ncbi:MULTISPECIES: GGDEF domain-containing protein [Sphingomonadales]|uniref:diguanylate cyclase n=2 Tax=Edaphosphingomonas TaxID=3423724 RepID=A0A2T4I5N3_9SPHN|nr:MULTISPECIES: GGDEF domain-containing protein [Sphingomonas]AGH50750.1 diguanylate cyclase [Sphingomonas sp. MM-1]MDX3884870.1 GGDEF domain-containing protein [Sphingomonas sp.]OHT19163.1 Response regulator PleD [Sphingomonas haloaromaticamans]PTD25641.1 GGDEF domain-containing protein [Sphingomonas fennica]
MHALSQESPPGTGQAANDGSDEAPAGGTLFARIGALLEANGLDPSPAHYELFHRYLTSGDKRLVTAVDEAIARYGRLNPAMAASIAAQRQTAVSAAQLRRLADEAQRRLQAIAALADRSGRDALDYGDALARNVSMLEGGLRGDVLVALLDLTRGMIDKTRSVGVELRRTSEQVSILRRSLDEARQTAETDALTGLPNRRALENRMRQAFDTARKRGTPLALAICDIDAFKAVNDHHGHQLGDKVIKYMAGALARGASEQLFVARYGGEEFVILFENMTAAEAARHVDAVRREIAAREFKVAETGRPIGRLTFSAGVAAMESRKGPSSTLKSADAALYRAKRDGRNCVRVAD